MSVLPDLPHSIEAEKATLGSILLNREAVVAVAPWLQADYFYIQRHGQIYEAMLACYNARIPPDTRTVSEELRRRNQLEAIGGVLYLSELVDSVPTSYHVEYYARVVERTALLRRLISAGGKIAALGYEEQHDLETTLDRAEQTLFEVSQRRTNQDFIHIGQVIDAYYEQINYLQEHRGEVVGLPTGFRDLDQVTGGLQRSDLIILAARPGVGKCMAAWTLIDDPATGERVTIEEYVRRQTPMVYGISETGAVRPTRVSHWVDSGIQPCFQVRTRSGRTVDVTGHHPFLTIGGWLPLHKLKVGDSIAVPRVVPCFGADESWPIDLVRLLAYFIAEGGLTGNSPSFTNTDPVIINDFSTIIARHFPVCSLRKERITYTVAQPKGSRAVRGWVMPPNPVTAWLTELGLMGKLARAKAFPACVWRWSRRYLAEFLRVLMSCNGSIYLADGRPRIEFTVASQQLAQDVHHAFVRFGMVARFYQTRHGAWRVQMTDLPSILLFQQEIGWIGEKATRLTGMHLALEKRGGNIGHPPRETWDVVRGAAKRHGISLIELARQSGETVKTSKYAGYNAHTRRTIPRYRLAEYARILEHPVLLRAASPDLYWDEISAIEAIGAHQVYDLTVPDGANFIAQDVCVHNTSLVMSLAYNIATQYQGTVGIFSLEMSRDQLVQRLLSMETTIDTHRLRLGQLREEEMERVISAMGNLAAAPIYIEDSAGLSIMDVRSRARRLQSTAGIDLIIIDYLQLMQGRRSDNRVQEVSEISRGLKALARELNVPVIALSQLSRAVEGRTSHVPMLSDLRESGCLTGDTLVYLPDEGISRRIDSLVGEHGFYVQALNPETWKLECRPVTHAFATGRKPVYKMTTRLGRTIRATANHKFLSMHGWKRLDELSIGERMALPRRLDSPMTSTMKNAELALLGHLIGDGCTLPYHVIVSGKSDIERFISSVGALGVSKQLHQEAIADYLAHRGENTNRDIIPHEIWRMYVTPAMRSTGITSRKMQQRLGVAYCGTALYKQNISRQRATRLAEVIGSAEIAKLANSDVYWDEITSIETDGEEEVYDLTVEGLHNFVANDIVVHNSIEQDADIVMFIYREELYDPNTDKKGIAEIHIAKHRNGPVGVVPMRFEASTTRFMDLTYRTPEGY